MTQSVIPAGRQHRILEGPTVEALARARPCTLPELTALSKVPRFSKNKRKLYGQDIVMALQQVCPRSHPALHRALSLALLAFAIVQFPLVHGVSCHLKALNL